MGTNNNFNSPFGTNRYPIISRSTSYPYSNMVAPLNGRIINNVSEITPNEVPMDGSVGFFPMSNYSSIYAKSWNRDGTITTVEYVPVVQQDPVQVQEQIPDKEENPYQKFFEQILQKLDKIDYNTVYRNNHNKKSKENNSNE